MEIIGFSGLRGNRCRWWAGNKKFISPFICVRINKTGRDLRKVMNELCIVLSAVVATLGLAYTVTVDFKELAGILYIFSCFMYCSYIRTNIYLFFINGTS